MHVTSFNLMATNQQVHRGSVDDGKVWKGKIVKTECFIFVYKVYLINFWIHTCFLLKYVSSYISSYAHMQTVSTQIKHNSSLLQLQLVNCCNFMKKAHCDSFVQTSNGQDFCLMFFRVLRNNLKFQLFSLLQLVLIQLTLEKLWKECFI